MSDANDCKHFKIIDTPNTIRRQRTRCRTSMTRNAKAFQTWIVVSIHCPRGFSTYTPGFFPTGKIFPPVFPPRFGRTSSFNYGPIKKLDGPIICTFNDLQNLLSPTQYVQCMYLLISCDQWRVIRPPFCTTALLWPNANAESWEDFKIYTIRSTV